MYNLPGSILDRWVFPTGRFNRLKLFHRNRTVLDLLCKRLLLQIQEGIGIIKLHRHLSGELVLAPLVEIFSRFLSIKNRHNRRTIGLEVPRDINVLWDTAIGPIRRNLCGIDQSNG